MRQGTYWRLWTSAGGEKEASQSPGKGTRVSHRAVGCYGSGVRECINRHRSGTHRGSHGSAVRMFELPQQACREFRVRLLAVRGLWRCRGGFRRYKPNPIMSGTMTAGAAAVSGLRIPEQESPGGIAMQENDGIAAPQSM